MADLSSRKNDHLELAFKSRSEEAVQDSRFYYEPLTGNHESNKTHSHIFLNKLFELPLWVSSMTGGAEHAAKINTNLARACNEFKIGMGLGSCRVLLDDDKYFADFNMRPIIGNDLPLFANLGIAQVEKLLKENKFDKINRLVNHLKADGLIIHVNPFQEFLQPEGDRFFISPLQIISDCLALADFPIIIKEVGQGMGPESVKALLQLPIAALDFGAYGGTNFSMLELFRADSQKAESFKNLSFIGHTAEEMVNFVNRAADELAENIRCQQIIISGGIKDFLDGYYLMNKLNMHAIYAQGSALLKPALEGYDALKTYLTNQKEGLTLCKNFLRIK